MAVPRGIHLPSGHRFVLVPASSSTRFGLALAFQIALAGDQHQEDLVEIAAVETLFLAWALVPVMVVASSGEGTNRS